MKYKPLIICVGVIVFMAICSSLLSGASTENRSYSLNAKREYPSNPAITVDASVRSDSASTRMITLPNAKREVVSKTAISETANAL